MYNPIKLKIVFDTFRPLVIKANSMLILYCIIPETKATERDYYNYN